MCNTMCKWLSHLWAPRCPYDPPPDTVTSDEERQEFEQKEREIELRLRWIRYQADQLQRMEREHDEITDEQRGGGGTA